MRQRPTKPAQPEGFDKAAKIKLAVAVVVLLAAGVMIAQTMGWITLWGGAPEAPPEPPMTAEEQQERKIQVQQAQEEMEAAAKRPGTVTAGE